jgi:DGQHR domain-containing protein
VPDFAGFALSDGTSDRPVFVAALPGRWLRADNRVVTTWRQDDPIKGWQRIVSEERAQEIATVVLDQGRDVPNAIILATDSLTVRMHGDKVRVSPDTVFLVIDGQHRLAAQDFATRDAMYACVIHCGLRIEQMAELFLEINDQQRRVPASLRWDLRRLVRPEDDEAGVRAADLIFDLTMDRRSPLFNRVDLTGELPRARITQASLAPEIRKLVSRPPLEGEPEVQLDVLTQFFFAMKEADPDGYSEESGPLYAARVIRALLQLVPAMLDDAGVGSGRLDLGSVKARHFLKYFSRIKLARLRSDVIRDKQGSAGIAAIRDFIREMMKI